MPNKLRNKPIRPFDLFIPIILGIIFAFIFKEKITPSLTGGHTFNERTLLVQIVLFLAYTLSFATISFLFFYFNQRITDETRLKPRTFMGIIGGLTGGLIFILIYGTGTLDVSRVDWLFNLGDNAQHYLGWVFYRNDPWMFPIGFSSSLAYPGGACMCFTDSIPLLAIPFKIIQGWLPETFQYFGWWTLVSFMLQGALASLILYEVTKNRTTAVIAPLFFCTADILLFRVYRYTPLSGQWIVLLALYLYFLNKRETRWNWLWPLTHIMSVLIQGYFFVMVFVVFCGAMLERYLNDHKIIPVLKNLVISLASTALVMWLVGFFTDAVDMSNSGLGYFKANLNAFINPLPGWSRFFAPLPLAPDTYQNVNYLGLGILLLFITGLVGLFVHKSKPGAGNLRGKAGLFFIIPVLVVFALSNVITWNEHILFTYTLPAPLMRLWGVFRGTERMLWPVYYLIFIFAISQAARWSKRGWVTAAILMVGFGFQFTEVAPLLREFNRTYSQPVGKKTNLTAPYWEEAARQYGSVAILPLNLDNWASLTEFAANNRMRINYSYFARQSPLIAENASQKMDTLILGEFSSDEMTIIKSQELRKAVCEKIGEKDLLAYVDREWVLAPGFKKLSAKELDFAITSENSNCAGLSLPEFINTYRDKLLVFSAMTDATSLVDARTLAQFQSMGLAGNPLQKPGSSMIVVIWNNRVIYEQISDSPAAYLANRGDDVSGLDLPVELKIESAGKISGAENVLILINGKDYSYHADGINAAVVDPLNGRVVDTALFSKTISSGN